LALRRPRVLQIAPLTGRQIFVLESIMTSIHGNSPCIGASPDQVRMEITGMLEWLPTSGQFPEH